MITKSMTWGEIEKELMSYGITLEFGWHIMLSALLEQCDYIVIDGYGCFAQLKLMQDGKVAELKGE